MNLAARVELQYGTSIKTPHDAYEASARLVHLRLDASSQQSMVANGTGLTEEEGARQPSGKRKRRALSDDQAAGSEVAGGEEVPACQSCRKRKAKCSREQPCSVCERFSIDCVYDDRRQRPGMRTGAVEALTRRVSSLEQLVLGQAVLLRPLLLAGRADRLGAGDVSLSGSLEDQTLALKSLLAETAAEQQGLGLALPSPRPAIAAPVFPTTPSSDALSATDRLALPSNWRQLVEVYFEQIHRWIPVLHVRTFRQHLDDPAQLQRIDTVIHAIVSICLRLCPGTLSANPRQVEQICLHHRHAVMLRSMETFSVENLQASIIIAFDTVSLRCLHASLGSSLSLCTDRQWSRPVSMVDDRIDGS